MKEYIERGEQESILHNRYDKLAGLRPDFYAGYMMVLHAIEDDVPTAADVVEVRHGRWVHNENYEDWAEKYVCSECNRNAPSDGDYRHSLTDYCPHCGAKMDKEE